MSNRLNSQMFSSIQVLSVYQWVLQNVLNTMYIITFIFLYERKKLISGNKTEKLIMIFYARYGTFLIT